MRLLVKICGLKTPAAVDAALEAGADLIGFVFHPKSPRFVAPEAAAALAARAGGRAGAVALIVDQSAEAARALAAVVRPAWVQLHGAEPPALVRETAAATGSRTIKAIGVAESGDLATLPAYATVSDLLLIDAKPPRNAAYPGGHGQPFDWNILQALDPTLPFMLSGGLTPDTVAEAIAACGRLGVALRGVDVSSGVESAPGVKDLDKIRAFVAAVRQAETER